MKSSITIYQLLFYKEVYVLNYCKINKSAQKQSTGLPQQNKRLCRRQLSISKCLRRQGRRDKSKT